ncbi:MAG TPA: PmoA family protein [Prolixibacteraceae bacterium]|nr:PmoA family protein [Prolixibacteraceae bacterium]
MNRRFWFFLLIVLPLAGSGQIEMLQTDEGILFTEQGKEVIYYQTEPKSLDGRYSRCHYFHPVWGLNGQIISEDFPADHLHHRGVFWAWHQVWINGERIGDPWEIRDFEQEVTEVEFLARRNGNALLKSEVEWKSPLWKKGETPYLKENSEVVIYPRTGNFRRIDFTISLLALEEGLSIGGSEDEKGYSGFSVRMVLPADVAFSGPSGKVTPQNTAVESPGYVNVSSQGEAGNQPFGVVILDHPKNPGYPQPWILRRQKSMQNIVFPGNKTVPVSTVTPLVLRYTLLIHNGRLTPKQIGSIQKKMAAQKF